VILLVDDRILISSDECETNPFTSTTGKFEFNQIEHIRGRMSGEVRGRNVRNEAVNIDRFYRAKKCLEKMALDSDTKMTKTQENDLKERFDSME
jgi:hypothetical protein